MKITTMTLAVALAVVALAPAGAAEPAQNPPPAKAPPSVEAPLIGQADLLSMLERKDAGVTVLDVRTPAEFAAGHVPGARNISHDELPTRLDELAALRDKPVVVYCRSGRRTQIAVETLRKAGFTRLLHLEGDWLAWDAQKRPVEN